jgi:5-methylcytosine-specific restriction endonuclease McrA
MKKCGKCGKLKAVSKFYRSTGNRCKACHIKYVKKWRRENPSKISKINRTYRIKHKEQIRKYQNVYFKKYYKKNKYKLRTWAFRFDILKRDGFTCQYCGRKAPEVELEVDHVAARKNGGETSMDNCITACRQCNRGKSCATINF